MSITCCYQCTERHTRCHVTCEKYIEERAALDARNQSIRKKKNEEYALRRRTKKRFYNKFEVE